MRSIWVWVIAVAIAIAVVAAIYLLQIPSEKTETSYAATTPTVTTPAEQTTPTTTYITQTSPQATPTAPAQKEVKIRDVLGREVVVKVPVRRVVAIGPGALRLVVYLNATDKLVGIENLETRPPQGRDYAYVLWAKNLTKLPIVGQGGPDTQVNFEAVLKAEPDVIIMSPALANTPDEVQAKTGIPVITVSYGTVGGVNFTELFYSIKILGVVLGREQRAEELINYMKTLMEDLNRRTAGISNRPTVYVGAISFKGGQPFTSTQAQFPPLVLLNTPSIADRYGVKPGMQIQKEAILKEDPQIIFIDLGNYINVAQDFNKSKDFYCSLTAFKEGRVYAILPFNYYWTNVATLFVDAYYMGKVLYPDRFADVDPIKKADEIYTKFLGMPIYQKMAKDFEGGFRELTEFKCG
ncbi:MAG: iron ABC transporter substrate-binding protein [Thermoproteus sp.]